MPGTQISKSQLLNELHQIKQDYSFFLTTVDHLNDGVVLVQDEVIKYANNKFADLIGYKKEQIINAPYLKFIPPEELPKVAEIHKKRLKGEKTPSRYESALLHREGRKIFVEFTINEISYKGKPGVLALIRDISERKRLENEINERAAFLESILENAPEAIALYDPAGKLIQVNRAFHNFFGFSQEDIKKGQAQIAPNNLIKESNELLEKARAGQTVRIETTRVNKNGESLAVRIIASPIRKDNKIIAIFIIWTDLTKLKNFEKKVQKIEERFRAIFEGSRDAIFIADENARFIEVNQAACELTGYSKEELLKMSIPDLHEKRDLHAYKRYFHRIMKGESILSEAKILRKDGTKVNAEFSNKRILIDGIPYMHTAARDITEWKKDKEKIKASLKEKSIMLQEIHHRVKNNLQIIISLMRIQARRAKHKETKQHLRTLQDRVFSMANAHEHFYRQPELDKINIATYIKGMVDHLCFLHNKSEKEIKIGLDLEEIYLALNKAIPFGMLLNEIVTNTLKHAFPGKKKGELSIRLYRDGNKRIRLYVADNGVGIPESVDRNNPETMGLQLINDLTHQIGGEVKIKNDKGTKINIIFPEKN